MRNHLSGIGMCVMLVCGLGAITTARGQQAKISRLAGPSQLQPLMVPHLYWHFLVYISILDKRSDELAAQGKGETWLRDDLQRKLGFSDADFAPLRIASQRLTSELASLNKKSKAIMAAGHSASTNAQLKALIAQRDSDIDDEIAFVRRSLPLDKQAALEAFMKQFFAPKPLTYHSGSGSSQSAGKATNQ